MIGFVNVLRVASDKGFVEIPVYGPGLNDEAAKLLLQTVLLGTGVLTGRHVEVQLIQKSF